MQQLKCCAWYMSFEKHVRTLYTIRIDTLSLMIAYRHGFWGIFLLAAWPNALFDLCGICCGHFLMPFWEFIGATMAGKALVKARSSLPFC